MDNNNLLKRLRSIQDTLNLFYGEYKHFPDISFSSSLNIISISSSKDTHNNNNTDKTDDDDDKTYNQTTGIIIVSGISLFGTYLLATDDYLKLKFSKMHDNVNKLAKITNNDNNQTKPIITNCNKWMKHYVRRTRPIFISKIGILLSGVLFGIGQFINNKNMKLVTSTTCIWSLCYLLWNYIDEPNKKNKEIEYFNTAKLNIGNVISLLSTPTAPIYQYNLYNYQTPTAPVLDLNT